MLLKEMQKLVDTNPRKPRRRIQAFEEALDLLVIYSIKISKARDESRLTEWEDDCPTAPDVSWKSVKDDIQDIVMYTLQWGIAQEFHSEHIKLLPEVRRNHFL